MNEWLQFAGTIIVALLSLIGVVVTNNKSNREMNTKIDKTQAVFEAHVTEQINGVKADLLRVEKKQDKYNNLIERTFALEKTTELQNAEIKRHGERIKILEKGD